MLLASSVLVDLVVVAVGGGGVAGRAEEPAPFQALLRQTRLHNIHYKIFMNTLIMYNIERRVILTMG